MTLEPVCREGGQLCRKFFHKWKPEGGAAFGETQGPDMSDRKLKVDMSFSCSGDKKDVSSSSCATAMMEGDAGGAFCKKTVVRIEFDYKKLQHAFSFVSSSFLCFFGLRGDSFSATRLTPCCKLFIRDFTQPFLAGIVKKSAQLCGRKDKMVICSVVGPSYLFWT